jgi:hypothetical protein
MNNRSTSERPRKRNNLNGRQRTVLAARSRPPVISKSQIRQMIESRLNNESELKYLSSTLNTSTIDYNGNVTDLCLVAQGVGDSQRVGDHLKWLGLTFAYTLENIAVTPHSMRIIIFQWHPNNTPSSTSVLLGSGSVTANLLGYNQDQNPQFTVMYDRLHAVNSNAFSASAQGDMVAVGHMTINIPVKQAQFTGATTAGTEHVYLLMMGDASSPNINIKFGCKVQYTDD